MSLLFIHSCYYVTIVHPFMLLCHCCSAIQTDIKDKLDSKGRNERRYITKHLIEYDEFMEDSTGASEMVSAMHLRSKPIITAFRAREREAERGETAGRCYHAEQMLSCCLVFHSLHLLSSSPHHLLRLQQCLHQAWTAAGLL